MLEEILAIQSHSKNQFRMFAYLIRHANKKGYKYTVSDGNIYVTKGKSDIYPCMVSHMDTVHRIVENLSIIRCGGLLTGFNLAKMTQVGIGGDDKVGVYITLMCLDHFDNFKAVFFRDEEIGCVGSYRADDSFFDDVSMVLQCDRRGNSDFVTNAGGTELSSKEFQDYVSSIVHKNKYSFCDGMMTDVMALKELGIRASMANMSCGYYNPHRENEYVSTTDVKKCLDMCIEIFSEMGDRDWSFDQEPMRNRYSSRSDNYKYDWDQYLLDSGRLDVDAKLITESLMNYYGAIYESDLGEYLAFDGFNTIEEAYEELIGF